MSVPPPPRAGVPIGLALGAAGALWLSRPRGGLPAGDAERGRALEPALAHPAAAAGLPIGSETIRAFTGYVACFDSRTRNPRWVLERLSRHAPHTGAAPIGCTAPARSPPPLPAHRARDSLTGGADRQGAQFVEDAAVDARFRTRNDDYARR